MMDCRVNPGNDHSRRVSRPFPSAGVNRSVTGQKLFSAQHHGNIDHLAIEFDRTAACCGGVLVSRNDSPRGINLLHTGPEFLVENWDLRGVNDGRAEEPEPTRAAHGLAES